MVRAVFVGANNFIKSGTLMLNVIAKLEEAIDLHDLNARGQLGLNTLALLRSSTSARTATS